MEQLNLQHFRYNFIPNFSQYELIEEEDKDNTIYYDPETERFIKFLLPLDAEVKYMELKTEIIIGKFLHMVDPKHFVNIIGYVKFPCPDAPVNCEGLITERIKGQTLSKFIPSCSPEDFKEAMIRLFTLLIETNKKYKFVHHDLHFGNLFVGEDLEPVLLDFGSSYIEIPCEKFPKFCQVSIIPNTSESSNPEIFIPHPLEYDFEFNENYILVDIVRVLTSSYYMIPEMNYRDLLTEDRLWRSFLLFKGDKKPFLNDIQNIKNVEDFVRVMDKYPNIIEYFDREYNKINNETYSEIIDRYRDISIFNEENYERIAAFCLKALQILDLPKPDFYSDPYFIEYTTNYRTGKAYTYKSYDPEKFLEQVKKIII